MTIPDDIRALYRDFRNSVKEAALCDAIRWAIAGWLEAELILGIYKGEKPRAYTFSELLAVAERRLREETKDENEKRNT